MMKRIEASLAVLLLAGPLAAPSLAGSSTYTFASGSEIVYYVVHPMHKVKGANHALTGKVTLSDEKLVTPLKLALQLIKFDSGNTSRDTNAAGVLEVGKFPLATLDVLSFAEKSHTKDATGLHIAGTASGKLNLHGISRSVSIPLTGVVSGNNLTVDGEFIVKFTDFGLTRPSLLFKPVEDDIRVTIHGVATGG